MNHHRHNPPGVREVKQLLLRNQSLHVVPTIQRMDNPATTGLAFRHMRIYNAVYPYMCLLDMCYSLNVETVFMCVYCIYKTVVCFFSYIRTRPVCLYAYISVLCITCVEHVSRSICVYLNIKSLMLCNQHFCGMLCTVVGLVSSVKCTVK